MKKTFLIISVVLLLISGLYLGLTRVLPKVDEKPVANTRNWWEPSSMHPVVRIEILESNLYDVTLENEERILAKLDVNVAKNAKPKLILFLNHCVHPRIVKKEKDGDIYIVGFWVVHEGVLVNVADWLTENGLVYEKSVSSGEGL